MIPDKIHLARQCLDRATDAIEHGQPTESLIRTREALSHVLDFLGTKLLPLPTGEVEVRAYIQDRILSCRVRLVDGLSSVEVIATALEEKLPKLLAELQRELVK